MRRKILCGLLIAITAACTIVGCGNSKQSEYEKQLVEMGFDEKDAKDIANDFADLEKDVNGDKGITGNTEMSEQEFLDSLTVPAKLKEWNDVSLDDLAIQIDDILWKPGITAEEAIKILENASVNYEYEVNLDKLIDGGEGIVVKREGIEWFTLGFHNFNKEISSLRSCPLVSIVPSNTAVQYSCRVLNGDYSYSDIMNLDINSISEINTLLAAEGFNVPSSAKLKNEYTKEVVCANLIWTGFEVKYLVRYSIDINADTSKVESFSFIIPGFFIYNIYRMEAPSTVEGWISLSKEQKDTLINRIKESIVADYKVEECEIGEEMYICCQKVFGYDRLYVAFTVNNVWHAYSILQNGIFLDINGNVNINGGCIDYNISDGVGGGMASLDELQGGNLAGKWVLFE